MIAYIKGTVAYTTPECCVVDVGGVGYQIYVAHPYTFTSEQPVCFYTFHYVKEDTDVLYGFLTLESLQTYQKLLSVKGIGPKVALSVLAATKPEDLLHAIETDDIGYLRKIPGIGPKAAGQIIFDLKGKIISSPQQGLSPVLQEASEALRALGYTQKEIAFAIKNIADTNQSVEDIVRQSLKNLMG